eukprot:1030751-Lingulodinium_polyedra.AAC.1
MAPGTPPPAPRQHTRRQRPAICRQGRKAGRWQAWVRPRARRAGRQAVVATAAGHCQAAGPT